MPFVSALLVQSIFLKENQKGDCWVQSIYKPAVFFKENQKGDAYSVYPGVFTRWILGLWFSLKVHGLQIGRRSQTQKEFYLPSHFFPLGDDIELSTKVLYETVISPNLYVTVYLNLCELQVSHHNIHTLAYPRPAFSAKKRLINKSKIFKATHRNKNKEK